MTRLTICPHFILNYDEDDPLDIQEKYIAPLQELIEAASSEGIEVLIYDEIFDQFKTSFPWNLLNDPLWSDYIALWYDTLILLINKHCKVIGVEEEGERTVSPCNKLPLLINDLFSDFLDVFMTADMPSNMSEEGIVVTQECGHGMVSWNGKLVYQVADIKEVKFPWLRFYKKPLPVAGDYPFIPPNNWKTHVSPRRSGSPRYGYIDSVGHKWEWDMLHKDHWDVQMRGTYKNISPDGYEL